MTEDIRDKMFHCKKHDKTFRLLDGCPECIAEKEARKASEASPALQIVQVKYQITKKDNNTGKEVIDYQGRAYAYFSEDRLDVGDLVKITVPNESICSATVVYLPIMYLVY